MPAAAAAAPLMPVVGVESALGATPPADPAAEAVAATAASARAVSLAEVMGARLSPAMVVGSTPAEAPDVGTLLAAPGTAVEAAGVGTGEDEFEVGTSLGVTLGCTDAVGEGVGATGDGSRGLGTMGFCSLTSYDPPASE